MVHKHEKRERLSAHFEAAEYCVDLDGEEPACFRIGAYDAGADRRLLRAADVESHWAVVTPYNPGATRLSDADNCARLAQMGQDIDRAGLHPLPAVNRDPRRQWPDEHGYCLIDAPAGFAEDLGRKYGQAAIVAARPGVPPRLVWL